VRHRSAIAVVAWLGACGRFEFDPHIDASMVEEVAVDARPVGNRAFVTSSRHLAGSLGGLAAADAICMARAGEAELAGRFVAYLSTTAVNAMDRLAGARGWSRVDGEPVVDTVSELVGGRMLMPLRIDERGNDVVLMPNYVTTGSFGGTLAVNCADYTDPIRTANAGRAPATAGGFSNQSQIPCNDPTRLYCFQIDHAIPLAFTPTAGRRAFVSGALFPPTNGVAAADAICANEAQLAGFTGTFAALLPSATTPASQRFGAAGPPWVRPDGVVVAATAADLLAGALLAPINVRADGTYYDGYAHTGFYPPTGPVDPTRNCDGWTNAGTGGGWGYAATSDNAAFSQTTTDCTTAVPVYCLEQ
jgi:hypothetical protein